MGDVPDPHWLWLLLGLMLGIAEIVAPGIHLIWLGAAAMLTGFATLGLGLPPAAQFALFAGSSVIIVYLARRWFLNNPIDSPDPMLNDRTARLIGETVTVVEAIGEGEGHVRIGDGIWSAKGPAAAPGTRVRVVGADGGTLIVEPD